MLPPTRTPRRAAASRVGLQAACTGLDPRRPRRHARSRRHLLLDAGTLNALSIFRAERHPSLMGIGTSKEGFSVYGLLNRCATHMVCVRQTRCHQGLLRRACCRSAPAVQLAHVVQQRPHAQQTRLNPHAHPQGRALLRQWCLSPVADLEVLAQRHDAIEALMGAPDLAASVAGTLKKVGVCVRMLHALGCM